MFDYIEPERVPDVIAGWRLSSHARKMIAERGFHLEDVVAVLSDPRQTYPTPHYGEGRWVYQRGHVAVVVHRPSRRVITVLLKSWSHWTDDDARRANRGTA